MPDSGIQKPEVRIQNELSGSHSEISSKTRQKKTISTMQVFLSQGDGHYGKSAVMLSRRDFSCLCSLFLKFTSHNFQSYRILLGV
jgi:hypothetical protein